MEFCRKFFPRRTKYDLKTFNGSERNFNRILIVDLLLLAKKCDMRTSGIVERIVCAYITSKMQKETDKFVAACSYFIIIYFHRLFLCLQCDFIFIHFKAFLPFKWSFMCMCFDISCQKTLFITSDCSDKITQR